MFYLRWEQSHNKWTERLRQRPSKNQAQPNCPTRSEEHTSELQSQSNIVCRLLLEKKSDLPEYSVPTYKGMGEVPRAGNDSGGGQLGNAIHCKPHGANDWLYVVVQEAVWEYLAKRMGPDVGMPDMASDPRFAKIGDRRKNQNLMWTLINKFAENYTKRELMAILNPLDVPCGPIMSTQDLANDEHVKGRDMWVELDHPQRGKWWNVGMPIKLSASPAKIERSPMLGEHTDEVLKEVLGYDQARINSLRSAGAFSVPPKKAA